MRILLDYRPALVRRTGVGEYAHGLATALAAVLGGDDRLTLFSSSWKDRLEAGRVCGASVVDARVPVHLLNLLWHRLGWPPVDWLAGAADVVHSLHPLLIPARRAAQVVTVHDVYFLDRADSTAVEIRRDYADLASDHARRADAVVVVSKYTAAQTIQRLGVDRERIAVCPPGAPSWPPRPPARGGPIVCFGSSEPRKNLTGLLDAYEQLLAAEPQAPPLLIAGGPPLAASEISRRLADHPLRGRARHLGYVSDLERRRLYEQASVVVVPSLDEGFGMTALEAMTVGVPVVASDRGALPEVIGDAGILVDPGADGALADAMARMLRDKALAERCVETGRRRAAAFAWTNSARALRQAYADAVARRRQHA